MPVDGAAPRRWGFTLLELLLVLVILCLLVALLFPVLQAARRHSSLAVCTGHLRQLGQAYRMYADDFGTFPDPPHVPLAVRDRSVLFCPADDGRERLASSYRFRALVLPALHPYWEYPALPDSTVLVICPRHTEAELRPDRPAVQPPPFPFDLALRAGGAVQRLRLDQIRDVVVPGTRLTRIRVYPGEPGYGMAQAGAP